MFSFEVVGEPGAKGTANNLYNKKMSWCFKRLLVDTSMFRPAKIYVVHFSHRKSTQITHRMSHFSLVLNVFRLCQAAADGPAARQVQISSPLLPPE